MMAKRKYDDVEEEDIISDDILNPQLWWTWKRHYGGEISDDQLNELYDQLDQKELDALNIDLGVKQSGGALFNFEFQNAGSRKNWKKTADKQRYEATSSRHELHPKAIILEKWNYWCVSEVRF